MPGLAGHPVFVTWMKEFCHIVAGHCFSVEAGEGVDLTEALLHYAPFAADPATAPERLFRLHLVREAALPVPDGLTEEFDQNDDGSRIRLFRMPDGGSWFEFCLGDTLSGRMLAAPGYGTAKLALCAHPAYTLGNALMVLYALSSARFGTALFHAAVIGYEGRGYLFLGRSGTGKSTHARLWLKHVPGSELVNDDNPVVRVFPDGSARVYGSPWSGKTPCYRNLDFPVGGFVQLEQAPFNAIRRLYGITAYAVLLPGISGKRWDRSLADGLHETENALATNIPVWHLQCLPDEAAARLCHDHITHV